MPYRRPGDVNLADLMYSGYLCMTEALDRQWSEHGMTDLRPAHGQVFQHLDPEGTRVTELAARARMTRQAMAQLVDHLEARGYVERIPDARDGRAKIVTATDRGVEAMRVARDAFSTKEEEFRGRFGAAEVASTRALLQALHEELWSQELEKRGGAVSA